MTWSIIATYYSKYGKLLGNVKNKPILNNNKIVRNPEDAKKTKDARNKKDIEDAKEAKYIRNTEEARNVEEVRYLKNAEEIENIRKTRHVRHTKNVRNVGDAKNARDNRVARCNNKVDESKNQKNWRTTIKNMVHGVIDIINLIDKVFVEVLTHIFGLLSPGSNLLSGIFTAYISQFFYLLICLIFLLQIVLVTNSNFFFIYCFTNFTAKPDLIFNKWNSYLTCSFGTISALF